MKCTFIITLLAAVSMADPVPMWSDTIAASEWEITKDLGVVLTWISESRNTSIRKFPICPGSPIKLISRHQIGFGRSFLGSILPEDTAAAAETNSRCLEHELSQWISLQDEAEALLSVKDVYCAAHAQIWHAYCLKLVLLVLESVSTPVATSEVEESPEYVQVSESELMENLTRILSLVSASRSSSSNSWPVCRDSPIKLHSAKAPASSILGQVLSDPAGFMDAYNLCMVQDMSMWAQPAVAGVLESSRYTYCGVHAHLQLVSCMYRVELMPEITTWTTRMELESIKLPESESPETSRNVTEMDSVNLTEENAEQVSAPILKKEVPESPETSQTVTEMDSVNLTEENAEQVSAPILKEGVPESPETRLKVTEMDSDALTEENAEVTSAPVLIEDVPESTEINKKLTEMDNVAFRTGAEADVASAAILIEGASELATLETNQQVAEMGSVTLTASEAEAVGASSILDSQSPEKSQKVEEIEIMSGDVVTPIMKEDVLESESPETNQQVTEIGNVTLTVVEAEAASAPIMKEHAYDVTLTGAEVETVNACPPIGNMSESSEIPATRTKSPESTQHIELSEWMLIRDLSTIISWLSFARNVPRRTIPICPDAPLNFNVGNKASDPVTLLLASVPADRIPALYDSYYQCEAEDISKWLTPQQGIEVLMGVHHIYCGMYAQLEQASCIRRIQVTIDDPINRSSAIDDARLLQSTPARSLTSNDSPVPIINTPFSAQVAGSSGAIG